MAVLYRSGNGASCILLIAVPQNGGILQSPRKIPKGAFPARQPGKAVDPKSTLAGLPTSLTFEGLTKELGLKPRRMPPARLRL